MGFNELHGSFEDHQLISYATSLIVTDIRPFYLSWITKYVIKCTKGLRLPSSYQNIWNSNILIIHCFALSLQKIVAIDIEITYEIRVDVMLSGFAFS